MHGHVHIVFIDIAFIEIAFVEIAFVDIVDIVDSRYSRVDSRYSRYNNKQNLRSQDTSDIILFIKV